MHRSLEAANEPPAGPNHRLPVEFPMTASVQKLFNTKYKADVPKLWNLIEKSTTPEVRRVLGGMITGDYEFAEIPTDDWTEQALNWFGVYGNKVTTKNATRRFLSMYFGSGSKRKKTKAPLGHRMGSYARIFIRAREGVLKEREYESYHVRTALGDGASSEFRVIARLNPLEHSVGDVIIVEGTIIDVMRAWDRNHKPKFQRQLESSILAFPQTLAGLEISSTPPWEGLNHTSPFGQGVRADSYKRRKLELQHHLCHFCVHYYPSNVFTLDMWRPNEAIFDCGGDYICYRCSSQADSILKFGRENTRAFRRQNPCPPPGEGHASDSHRQAGLFSAYGQSEDQLIKAFREQNCTCLFCPNTWEPADDRFSPHGKFQPLALNLVEEYQGGLFWWCSDCKHDWRRWPNKGTEDGQREWMYIRMDKVESREIFAEARGKHIRDLTIAEKQICARGLDPLAMDWADVLEINEWKCPVCLVKRPTERTPGELRYWRISCFEVNLLCGHNRCCQTCIQMWQANEDRCVEQRLSETAYVEQRRKAVLARDPNYLPEWAIVLKIRDWVCIICSVRAEPSREGPSMLRVYSLWRSQPGVEILRANGNIRCCRFCAGPFERNQKRPTAKKLTEQQIIDERRRRAPESQQIIDACHARCIRDATVPNKRIAVEEIDE
jgi:hypothetical protein